jgi:plastocyanin
VACLQDAHQGFSFLEGSPAPGYNGLMRSPLLLLGAALLFLGITSANPPSPEPSTGTLTGIVRYTGKVPPPQKITTADGSTILHNDLVVDPKTAGLRFVVALLEDAPAQPRLAKAKPVVVDQRDMIFLPRVVAVQQGQAVRFENHDGCNHSVLASSTLRANQFNLFINGNQTYEHVFELQNRPVQIGCSLHGWMRAWVYVVPHPWFAVSDAEGKFQIEQVPPGKYSLWLRHADSGHEDRRAVEFTAGKTTQLKLDWEKVGK